MTCSAFASQLASLRGVVFDAVDAWNAAHPHPLDSRRERGCVNVTQVYSDASDIPSYSITVMCALSGTPQLTFHGHDAAAVAEQARWTLERKIAVELQRRTDAAYGDGMNRDLDIAV